MNPHLPVCCDTIVNNSAAALVSSVSSPPITAGKSRQRGNHCLYGCYCLITKLRWIFYFFFISFTFATFRRQEDLQHMSHGDQMHNVKVVIGSADCRWLQVNSLLLVQRGRRQDQRHLEKHIFSSIRLWVSLKIRFFFSFMLNYIKKKRIKTLRARITHHEMKEVHFQ